MSAEKDEEGNEILANEPWTKMNTSESSSSNAMAFFNKMATKATGGLEGDELIKVSWLSVTLFFIVGGYWLLRSLKDPIMSVISGVEYIPQAKMASLFVVFGLVIVYNKLLDIYPKHQLFYMMGLAYGFLFTLMGLLLMHPTIGLNNTDSSPYRLLGWISYCTIESFGSMVVQCYWALVNASVDMPFAKKNFGLIVAGAQIGSILGPTVAMNANYVGIPALYLFGAVIMFLMVGAMYLYMQKFGTALDIEEAKKTAVASAANRAANNSCNDNSCSSSSSSATTPAAAPAKPKGDGVMEGFYLFWDNDFVKGIFAISAVSMVQVTILDYTMKVLVKSRYDGMYPDDPQAAVRAFATFMGFFGQMTNTISFLFSLLGTGFVIKRFGLTNTMISYPVLLLLCAVLVYIYPSLWVVFSVMMLLKGMSYALNNPCKEILYQVTNSQIKFKCKSWIDTFGQRSAKAGGSIITNAFATSLPDLVAYGSLTGVAFSVLLIWVSIFMGKEFEERTISGVKVGDTPTATHPSPSAVQEYSSLEMSSKGDDNEGRKGGDTSCGLEEEGQAGAGDVEGGNGGVRIIDSVTANATANATASKKTSANGGKTKGVSSVLV